jgi:hypothetical protein
LLVCSWKLRYNASILCMNTLFANNI